MEKKKPVLVYANDHEIQHIKYRPCYDIKTVMDNSTFFKNKQLILFGCSGLIGNRKYKNYLLNVIRVYYASDVFDLKFIYGLLAVASFHAPLPVHEKSSVNMIKRLYSDAVLVDQESGYFAEQFPQSYIVRYVIDQCDKKIFPFPFNYFWRKWQHYTMQKKMERFLNEFNKTN